MLGKLIAATLATTTCIGLVSACGLTFPSFAAPTDAGADATRRTDGAAPSCTGPVLSPCDRCLASNCCGDYLACANDKACGKLLECASSGSCNMNPVEPTPPEVALFSCVATSCTVCMGTSTCMAVPDATADACGGSVVTVIDAGADSGARDAGADSGARDAGTDSGARDAGVDAVVPCVKVDLPGCTKSAQCCQNGTNEPVGAGCLVLSGTASNCTARCNNFGDCPSDECCIENESSIPRPGSPPTEPGGLCATVPVAQALDKPCVFKNGNGYICSTADGGYSCSASNTMSCNSAGSPEQFCITFGTESMAEAKSTCSSVGGTLSTTPCPMTSVLGTCRESLELFWYYAVPGQTASVAQMECSAGTWTPWPDGGF